MPKKSYKGYYGIMKGIVTRTDDPEMSKNNNRRRIQVCIPAYHGSPFVNENSESRMLDTSKTGSGNDLGKYPWAQVCSNMFNGNSSNDKDNIASCVSGVGSFLKSVISIITGTGSASDTSSLEMIYPSVGDYVWLMFEGGDIRCPVYIGALSADIRNQQNALNKTIGNHTSTGNSLGDLCYKMIADINEYSYEMVSNANSSYTRFGILGWHGSKAKSLLRDIRDSSPTTFSTYISSNSAEKFVADLDSSDSWANYKVRNNSNIHSAVVSILGTDTSISCQNNKALTEMNEIINRAQSAGLTSQGAIMLYVHTYYNGFSDIADTAAKKCSNGATLDNLYKCVMDRFASYSNTTKSYRKKAYEYIMNLANTGKIISDKSTNSVGSISDPGTPTGSTPSISSTIKTTNVVTPSNVVASNGPNTDAIKPKNFKQFSGSWAKQVFGPSGRPSGDTYSNSACSVTAMADIVYTFANSSVTPKTIGDLAISWGYRTASSNGLTDMDGFCRRCASHFGFVYKGKTKGASASYNKMRNALENGHNNTLTIIGVKGIYSNNGHFVVAWKTNGDKTCICDPGINSNTNNGQRRENASSSDLKLAINSVYIFQKN